MILQVYDVTPFMDEHPGGDEVLLAATGNVLSRNLPQSFTMYIYRFFLYCFKGCVSFVVLFPILHI